MAETLEISCTAQNTAVMGASQRRVETAGGRLRSRYSSWRRIDVLQGAGGAVHDGLARVRRAAHDGPCRRPSVPERPPRPAPRAPTPSPI